MITLRLCGVKIKPKGIGIFTKLKWLRLTGRGNRLITIHFVGFGNKFDEWRDCGVGDDQLLALNKYMFPSKNHRRTGGKCFTGSLSSKFCISGCVTRQEERLRGRQLSMSIYKTFVTSRCNSSGVSRSEIRNGVNYKGLYCGNLRMCFGVENKQHESNKNALPCLFDTLSVFVWHIWSFQCDPSVF